MNRSRDQEVIKDFGLKIKEARVAKGWTKEKLADKAETSVSQIYRIENGRINPRLTTITRITNVLGIELRLVQGD